ncbi:metal-sensitive transcriptional regulator [bacterium]|nr:metal-sensitive transcriptional regulator [bacterium]
MKNKQLVHRLNRAIGQIEGIKKKIENEDDVDCLAVLQQLKASINALKKFGEAYMDDHLDVCIQKGASIEEVKKNLKTVIAGAFSL